MKKIFLAACVLLSVSIHFAKAQSTGEDLPAVAAENSVLTISQQPQMPKYGLLRYDSLLHAMPEYGAMQIRLQQLRQKYEDEAAYNEMDFKRQFAEFLQGQKDFPQNILLKRQRDLQEAMEKSLAFRHDADSLLRKAAADMERPVRKMLDEAIVAVGQERGYECIANRDAHALPFVSPALSEDASPYVSAKLTAMRRGNR